ncbi:MAG: dTDP-4-dehydrorhamnose reductase [Capsulimonadaceae bacterium]
MRILITGSEGMLGNDVRRRFERDGHEVIRADLNGPAGEFFRLDITVPNKVLDLMTATRPDVVVHTAAYTNVDGCERDPETAFQVNGYGTWTVASAAEAVGAALVAISTDFVFDGARSSPYIEFDRPSPTSLYGASKLAGEEAALRACSRTYVLRTAWLYGIHGRNFPFTIIQRAREKGCLEVVADQFGTPTYTQDLADTIVEVIRDPLYGIYHASNDGAASWLDFAHAVLDRVGLADVPVHPLTSDECAVKFNTPTRRPPYSVLRNQALEMRSISTMRPWLEALDAFIAEAKDAGKI